VWTGWGAELTVALLPLLFIKVTLVPALTVKGEGENPLAVKVTTFCSTAAEEVAGEVLGSVVVVT